MIGCYRKFNIYVLLDLSRDWSVSNRQSNQQLRIQAKYDIFMRAGKLQITRQSFGCYKRCEPWLYVQNVQEDEKQEDHCSGKWPSKPGRKKRNGRF